MAGLILFIGKGAINHFNRYKEQFSSQKKDFLNISHSMVTDDYGFAKYCRKKENSDNNIFNDDTYLIYVVGTFIYNKLVGAEAIKNFRSDMDRNDINNLLQFCDGHFLLWILHKRENSFLAITDHAGILNAYCYLKKDFCIISTSSSTISKLLPITPDFNGISQFLRTASVYGDDTIYKEIKVLNAATVYKFQISNDGAIEKTQYCYWTSPTEINQILSFQSSSHLLKESLYNCSEIISKLNYISDLTAGYDSRLILSLLLLFDKPSKIDTFVFGPPLSREVKLVDDYCKELGVNNHPLSLPKDWTETLVGCLYKSFLISDGEENILAYSPTLFAQEFKTRLFDYSINGLGGELYRNFWWLQEITTGKRAANIHRLISTRMLQYEFEYSIFSNNYKKLIGQIHNILNERFVQSLSDMNLSHTFNTLQIDNLYFRQKMRRWAGRAICNSNQIINVLAPLSFKGNLSAAMTLPPSNKINARVVKSVINSISPKLGSLQMLNGMPCQNIDFYNFYKFYPIINEYFKKITRKLSQKIFKRTILVDKTLSYNQSDLIKKILHDSSFKNLLDYDSMCTQALYDPKEFKNFIKSVSSGKFLYSTQLGNIFTLEMRMRHDGIKTLDI